MTPRTDPVRLTLTLGEQIATLLHDSGATPAEQYSALDIARALVLVGACLTPAPLRTLGERDRSGRTLGENETLDEIA
jgi:hypothetical protein